MQAGPSETPRRSGWEHLLSALWIIALAALPFVSGLSFPQFAASTASGSAAAERPAPTAPMLTVQADPRIVRARSAWRVAAAATQQGPARIALCDGVSIAIAAGHGFVPPGESKAIIGLLGGRVDERFLGLVLPLDSVAGTDAQWFATLEYEPSGHVRDDEARVWSNDDLLRGLQQGADALNARRATAGLRPLVVTRWVQAPSYDAASHELSWAAETIGVEGDDRASIHLGTHVLGRDGYVSIRLVTSASAVEGLREAAMALRGAVSFDAGRRYADYDARKDRIADYGLAALVAGVALQPAGPLAAASAFFAKYWKLMLVCLAAAGGAFMRWRKDQPRPPP